MTAMIIGRKKYMEPIFSRNNAAATAKLKLIMIKQLLIEKSTACRVLFEGIKFTMILLI